MCKLMIRSSWSLLFIVLHVRHTVSQCGVPIGMSKIVGGDPVPTLRYPWYVALVQTDIRSPPLSVSCGGSLITNRHVLTAAHCFPKVSGVRPEQLYRAVFALVNRCGQGNVDSSALQKVDIFPSFNQKTLQGDLAVITLPRKVQYTHICLPPKHSTVSGPALVIGFGSTLAKSQYPCILQEATVNILTRKQCQRSGLEPQFSNLPGIYCAGVPKGGIDSCDGDSGGPIQTLGSNGVYTIQGIVSFGEGCARKNLPGVYTQVSFYRDFIDSVVHSTADNVYPEDWDYPPLVETEAGVDSLVPPISLTPQPSLTSLLQGWLQELFRPLTNMTATHSSSGSRLPVFSSPMSHRPLSHLQTIIQGLLHHKQRMNLKAQKQLGLH